MSGPAGEAAITMTTVYAEQVKMSAQLAIISDRLSQLPDHEARIRKLEAWKYALPPAAFGGVGSLVLSIWAVIHH